MSKKMSEPPASPPLAPPPPPSSSSRELQCVGRLEIAKPQPVGFLCGSIPVPTDKAFHDFNSSGSGALIPSSSAQTVKGPRYRMIPAETDLNTLPLPLLSSIPEKVLPIAAAAEFRTTGEGDIPCQRGAVRPNITRKGEALAVSGLAEYGDELDVIAPADILKQIFKIPYSRARLSIAVHRVGQTLVLNYGPGIEEGEKLVRKHSCQTRSKDQSLFLNFAMHSVRMEACDCPPGHRVIPEEQADSYATRATSSESCDQPGQGNSSPGQTNGIGLAEDCSSQEYEYSKRNDLLWGKKKKKRNKVHNPVKKLSQVKENTRSTVQESEKYKRVCNDGFLRVLFWQFHNFRMLLGSDLLIFSNEKYVAVSLHLWDVSRQVTPLTWLEAWLDNVMASVPELAICYHDNGVVQGYELLKTDDIFLLKGISEDGTPAFHPHVVQQNGLSVLRFLQENCKQDPGAYWLYKSAGEDAIQLFDLSVIPKNHSSNDCDDRPGSVPTLIHRGRSDSFLSLGTLLFRIAHRLSLSLSTSNRVRCARFLKKCLNFLDEPDHLVIRACAHEQFARLLLTYDEELDLTLEELPVECGITVDDGESFEFLSDMSELCISSTIQCRDAKLESSRGTEIRRDSEQDCMMMDVNYPSFRPPVDSVETDTLDPGDGSSSAAESVAVCKLSDISGDVIQTVADTISSKLAAVHHVSQAIKSLRWKRELQRNTQEVNSGNIIADTLPSSVDFSVCSCGDVDCIEVCDIREWLPTSKLDDKLWKLVLLLGESYLALGQAYKDNQQLYKALKVVDLACMVYGSMPQHLEDARFVSSMVCSSEAQVGFDARRVNPQSLTSEDHVTSNYLFWAKVWTLVGDVYVEFYLMRGNDTSIQAQLKCSTRDLKMSSEVLKELERLKKKLGQSNQNCNSCSLVNCSCQLDRARSGSSASSSTENTQSLSYGRKQNKKSYTRSTPPLCPREYHTSHKGATVNISAINNPENCENDVKETADVIAGGVNTFNLDGICSNRADGTSEMGSAGSPFDCHSDTTSKETAKVKNGGIFKYTRELEIGDPDRNLSVALNCYEEAEKGLGGNQVCSTEIQSVVKKKGWVCNELGRYRLERKELDKAEIAFGHAINSFREVADHTNIILINCNLGHGRRALAEEMVSKIEGLKKHEIFHNAYKKSLETAKLQYRESLKYYEAAKRQLSLVGDQPGSVSSSLRNEIYTQVAHTYLRLGMLLARDDTLAEIYEAGMLEDSARSGAVKSRREHRKHEISANDAIKEALSVYESLGELRKQEAAYAYFQLACYQRDCCLKFMESERKETSNRKGENCVSLKVKQYASLAERNWKKSMEFYAPKTHPVMYLTILMERASLSWSTASLRSIAPLESALACLLEGRHVAENASLSSDDPDVCAKFWNQLQMLLKKMLSVVLSTDANKSPVGLHQASSSKLCDVGKLKELYRMSLKSTEMSQLHAMHSVLISSGMHISDCTSAVNL